ncbi:ABC transporter substrate-binding protein [Mesorhizobium sp. VK24D]|uniref:ABC transporter substrate-binding protein n=1 Tax=Mesorhizobium album TaxID=3072314 RepID=A0ABU4YBV2_9HYPH|nr:ABC transporter substrate-binding protein [Mesorhizobium sp. VK24D]MDX8483429.1 ABC transporter substrate-binding protein [Mesorhizobium sp. VK24D]
MRALAVIGLVAGSSVMAKPGVAADQVRIASWGGAFQLAERKAWYEPFSKETGIAVVEDEYSGEAGKIRAMVESKAVTWDVIDGYNVWVNQLCDEGLLEKIDWAKLGLDRSKFLDGEKYDCGVPSVLTSGVIAYDKDKLADGPKTISDLFDTKKFPGKRGLEKIPETNLEWALIADGVPVKDVYKVLSTTEGVDRAFKKLDTIKKDIVWWEAFAVPPQLLADGQVVMTSAANGRIFDANKNSGKHFEIMRDAQIWGVSNIWVIPAGTQRLDEAYKFIGYVASAQVQPMLTKYIPYGPANKDGMALVDPDALPYVSNAPQNLVGALQTDPNFWNDHGVELHQRFTAWLAN